MRDKEKELLRMLEEERIYAIEGIKDAEEKIKEYKTSLAKIYIAIFDIKNNKKEQTL